MISLHGKIVATLVSFTAVISAAEPVSLKQGQAQLFLDNFIVAKIAGVTRTMHQPRKLGAVIRSPQPGKTIQTRAAPQWDPVAKVYKLWVLGIDQWLWESRDGLHWMPGAKPNMRTDLVVVDPLEKDPGRRFKAALANSGFAISPDGANWTKLDVPRIPSSDESNFSFNPAEGLFIHTVKRGGKYGRSVALATSRDFKNWTDYGLIFQSDDLDQKLGVENIKARLADASLRPPFHNNPKVYRVDVYNMGAFYYDGIYIGLPAMYHATGPVPNYPNTDGFHLVQLAMSRDLINWKRLGDRRPFIGPSRIDSGAYDLTQILPPSAPVVRDDELWFYYTGLKYRASYNYVGNFPKGKYVRKPGLDPDDGAVCLAVLRLDGFISLDAGRERGRVRTVQFRVPEGKLFVNADAGLGRLQVEALDAKGKLVTESVPLNSDKTRHEVQWTKGGLAKLPGRVMSLRFKIQDASLYSFWFGERSGQ